MPEKVRHFDTRVVQSGLVITGDIARPAAPPIVPSVGFVHTDLSSADRAMGYLGGTPVDPESYVYARHDAPNQAAFEQAIADLEGAEAAQSFSSGMAALHAAILSLAAPGDALVASDRLYGMTRALLDWLSDAVGLHVRYADFLNLEDTCLVIKEIRPVLVICEVLTNPLVRVVDVDALAACAAQVGAHLLVDNTFATPLLLRPLERGAQVVVHSTTKFLNGHGDVTGGVAAGSAELMQAVRGYRKLLGAVPSAFDAWLALRGLRTLALRLRQSCASAHRIAEWLARQPQISRVYYPGLKDDAGHLAARRLFSEGLYGSLIAFEIAGVERTQTFDFVRRLELIRPVTSLGDVYSLILHPASSSHRALTPEQRAAQGISEGILRLSVGIEDAADLIADLSQALESLSK